MRTRPAVAAMCACLGWSFFLGTLRAMVWAGIACAASTVAFAGTPPDPLWEKALAVARTNADWVPGLIITRSEIVHKGETNGVHEIWQRSKLGEDGEVITQTVKILEDGKDVTEEEKKEKEKEKKEKKEKGKTKKEKAADPSAGNPFAAESQARLSLALTNRSRTIVGRDCVGYLFAVRNTNGPTTQGLAWLQKETGIPAELENVTLDPLPVKQVKGMKISTQYESTPDGAWRVREMRTTGRISLFIISAEFRTTTTFSEYWKMPERKRDGSKDKGK